MSLQDRLNDRIGSHEDWKDGISAWRVNMNALFDEYMKKVEMLKKDVLFIKYTLKQINVDLDEDLRLRKVKIEKKPTNDVTECCGHSALYYILKDGYEAWDFCPECLECCSLIDASEYKGEEND